MECFTPKRDDQQNNMENDVCFKTLNKLTAISSHRAPSIKDFAIIKPISRGAFGKVFLGYKITDEKNLYAIKVMRKSEMINKNMVSQVITERNALALSRSPFCVNLFYSLQTPSYIYLVMEYMVGGDLKSLLTVSGYFDEPAAKFYCAEVAMALRYLHEHGIVHRDIKPDNMLVAVNGHVKLTDFGLSKIELSRDLEMSDLMNCSPSLNARTPGQLLSLTSHLSFGSVEKKNGCITNHSQITSKLMVALNRQKSPDFDQRNDSHVSGVSPFQSAEDIEVSFTANIGDNSSDPTKSSTASNTESSYYTCNSSIGNSKTSSGDSFKLKSLYRLSIPNNKFNLMEENSNSRLMDNLSGMSGLPNVNNNQIKLCDSKDINGTNESGGKYSFDLSLNIQKSTTNPNRETGEDSGISSRKSELSVNIHCELSAIEKLDHHNHNHHISQNHHNILNAKFQSSGVETINASGGDTGNSNIGDNISLDFYKSEYSSSSSAITTTNNNNHPINIGSVCCTSFNSPPASSTNHIISNTKTNKNTDINNEPTPTKYFKRPDQCTTNGTKRKRSIMNRIEDRSYGSSTSTGLTQEIDILDIGSSTPKKRKSKSPLKGVLKVRSLSDDEMPVNEHLNVGTVLFSTPVSSQKPRVGLLKLKSTRFALPNSLVDVSTCNIHNKENSDLDLLPSARYMKLTQEPAMSPINVNTNTNSQVTPKNMQTPYRTPKSVRRVDPTKNRILGTPDYLSPELLLSHKHGPEVDWWALGVCLYEFMTGIPPFNDETPQKVFDNILSKNIEWPEGDEALSAAAVTAVEQLLTMDPVMRPTAKEVKKMEFFNDIDWNALENIQPPFIPNPENPTDTGYFEARNVLQHLKLSSFDLDD